MTIKATTGTSRDLGECMNCAIIKDDVPLNVYHLRGLYLRLCDACKMELMLVIAEEEFRIEREYDKQVRSIKIYPFIGLPRSIEIQQVYSFSIAGWPAPMIVVPPCRLLSEDTIILVRALLVAVAEAQMMEGEGDGANLETKD